MLGHVLNNSKMISFRLDNLSMLVAALGNWKLGWGFLWFPQSRSNCDTEAGWERPHFLTAAKAQGAVAWGPAVTDFFGLDTGRGHPWPLHCVSCHTQPAGSCGVQRAGTSRRMTCLHAQVSTIRLLTLLILGLFKIIIIAQSASVLF